MRHILTNEFLTVLAVQTTAITTLFACKIRNLPNTNKDS